MFEFEKLQIYKKAKVFNAGIREFIKSTKLDNTIRGQLRRASFSIVEEMRMAVAPYRDTNDDVL